MEYSVSSVLSLISHVHSSASDFLQKKLSERGLPELASSHGFILFCLSRQKTMSMGEITSRINRDKSTATVLVRKLEALGLVKIEKDCEDSRKKIISLTEKGLEYNKVTASISKELMDSAYRNFSEDEKKEILTLLCRMAENLN